MGTVSLSNGTYPLSSLAPADTAGDDSVTLTNATIAGTYSPDGGNDLYSLTGSSVGAFNGFSFQGGLGNDTLTATDSTVNGRISLGDGSDSLYLQNVGSVGVIEAAAGDDTLNLSSVTITQGTRDILAGTGNDSVSMNAVSGATTVNLSTGSNSLTLSNTTVSGFVGATGGTADNQSIILNSSSVAGSLGTAQSSLNHLVLNDSTVNGAIFLNNFSVAAGSPASTIEIINGSQTNGAISLAGGAAAGADYFHIADSTIGAAIVNGDQGADATRADTMLIENATFTGAGNQINLSGNGDQVTVTGSELGNANINIAAGLIGNNYTISVADTTLNNIVNQSSGNASIDVVGSSLQSFSFQQEQASNSLTINVNDTTISADSRFGNSSDTVSLLNGSEFQGNVFDLLGGSDKLVLGTDTNFTNNTNNLSAGWGLNGQAGNDTLQLLGGGAFSISLEAAFPARLQNGSTVTLVTNDNWEQVAQWGQAGGVTNIRGTLSLAESNSTVLIQQFESFEAIPCFVNGTMIMTDKGERPVESLRIGDLIQTADAGLQPIRWVSSSHVNALNMLLKPEMVPIRITQGALGNGLPVRDLLVSPQHRMLVSSKVVERMFGTDQVLVAAKHLLDIDGIERATEQTGFEYIHFMLDDHHIAYAEGAPTESLFIGEMSAEIFGESAQKELELIFPELTMPVSDRIMKPARLFVTRKQGRNLAQRVSKNGHCLVSKKDGVSALLSASAIE